MKHFKNITSLSELKKQYKALAIVNHPDRGGDTAVMQEINAEFDAMFAVLKNRPDIPKTAEEQQETGSTYRRHFYNAHGWEGCRYDGSLRITEISARVKVYAKERYPEYKFSVRTEYYSGGASIHLRLVSGPVPAITADSTRDYISTMGSIDNYPGISDEVRAVVADVVAYANSFNYDDSDSMTDYFDVNFYLHIYIGTFDKPYQVVNPKVKKVSGRNCNRETETAKEPTQEASAITEEKSTAAVFVVEYSKKAVAVLGDTKAIKDDLKRMGGRFNGSLTVAGERVAGWIFSKAKESEVMEYIKGMTEEEPQAIADKETALPKEEKTEPAKMWAAPGRMGCVVCGGMVWYITPGDWVAMDERGVFCGKEGEPLEFAGECDVMQNAKRRDEGNRGRYFLHESDAYKYAEELEKQEEETEGPNPISQQEEQKEEGKTYQNLYPLKESSYKIFRHLVKAAHTAENQATKIDNGGAFMPVCVEVMRTITPDEELISIAHYGEQNGDAMRDPEMTFYHNRKTGKAYAMTFQNDYFGKVEMSVIGGDDGRPHRVNRRRQRQQTDFAEAWLRNIKHQQTLKI